MAGSDHSGEKSGGQSALTVLLAGGANLTIAVLKAAAGVITGSAAMLSEAGHSVADTFTEVLLLAALRRSGREPDRTHPFGYGKERYFWSLLASVSIFISGALFAFYQGFTTIFGASEEQSSRWVAYGVLALGFVIESVSWAQALRQVRHEARRAQLSFVTYLRWIDDPAPKTVLYEDTAALTGLLLAFGGIGLHHVTGSSLWDGLASVAIGALLAAIAYFLGRTNKGLLIGRQTEPNTLHMIRRWLERVPEVDSLVDLQTMVMGDDSLLVCTRVDLSDSLNAHDVERVCTDRGRSTARVRRGRRSLHRAGTA